MTSETSSPRSVQDHELSFPSEIGITIDQFKEAANIAFTFIKNKHNKTSINAGDALLELYNYESASNDDNNVHLTCLYCLAVLMLHSKKSSMDSETYDKILEYTKQKYIENLND